MVTDQGEQITNAMFTKKVKLEKTEDYYLFPSFIKGNLLMMLWRISLT